MSKYYNETAPLHQECIDVVNTFQSSLKCCGAMDPADWEVYSNSSSTPPASCCAVDKQDSCDYGITYKDGCIGVIGMCGVTWIFKFVCLFVNCSFVFLFILN